MPHVRTALSTGPSTIEYLRTGSGPGIVLVHGTGATPEANYSDLIAELKPQHTVVAPFLSGSGSTTDSGAPLTAEDLAQQVLAAADDAGLDDFALVGHSLGACVAAAASAVARRRIRSLVLHAGWAKSDPRMVLQFGLWQELVAASPELLARLVLLNAYDTDGSPFQDSQTLDTEVAGFAALFRPEGIGRQLHLDQHIDIEHLLPRVTAPTLIISGASDVVVPPAHQDRMAELIPHAELIRVQGGHAFPFESPDEFIGLVADFISTP
ncbi:alpha/beta fold hydrolase [Streptomyces luteolus]|uniref:Alpha/beta hydrolase n=1 Tax=Streptomyces luteolus TaxID=3043615 RepID=A0ABT6SZC3_9ACTN|nr:alpha/beta hydrolase [Streptomyces sp. B-S-A12]MDI3420725.1 alpha/beta hydrolase [Streptomyces sp. B-S-A12]